MTLSTSVRDREKNKFVQSKTRVDGTAVETETNLNAEDPNNQIVPIKEGGFLDAFSTNEPLANGDSFDSGIVDLKDYNSLVTQLFSDTDLSLQGFWYDDASGTNLIRTFTLPYDSNINLSTTSTIVLGRYLRYVVTNNSGVDQSVLYLRVKIDNESKHGQIIQLDQFTPSNVLVQLVRAVLTGENPNGDLSNVNISRDNNLLVDIDNISRTPFDELKTASRFSQIELKSAVDQVSNLRNFIETTDANVSVSSSGEYRVSTDAVLDASVNFESGERGRYIPGYQAEMGMGIRVPTQAWAGTQFAEWGYIDDQDGIGFGIDSGGVYVFVDRQGTRETKVYQSSWNVDTMDGSSDENNPTGYDLDITEGYIYQIEFVWYGYGAIQFFINFKDANDRKGSVQNLVHTVLPSGNTSIAQPNLPLRVRIRNGDQSTSREVFVGGRQFSVYGDPVQRFRVNGQSRQNTSTSNADWIPLISYRRKSGRGNNQSVSVASVNILADGNLYYTFVLSGTLTGASFGNFTDVGPTETVLETDISATAITGGTFFGGQYISTGNNQSTSVSVLDNLDFDFVNGEIVTLVARRIGNQNVTIDACTFNAREQW